MSETHIVIVGGGIAGLTAANRAAQLGLKALVLEKGSEDKYLCNTRYTGGTLHVCMNDIMSGEDALLEKIETICADVARPDLARAIAKDAERAVRWLQGEGCKFLKAAPATSCSVASVAISRNAAESYNGEPARRDCSWKRSGVSGSWPRLKVGRLDTAPTPLSSPMAVFNHLPNIWRNSSRRIRASCSSAMRRVAPATACAWRQRWAQIYAAWIGSMAISSASTRLTENVCGPIPI
jgi:hypothetical protein